MSAAILRRAAKLMRERAQELPPGPWSMRDAWGPAADGLARVPRIASDVTDGTVLETQSDYEIVGSRATFEHIASWHPGVALTVAGWLDIEAAIAERGLPDSSAAVAPALRVARAYLGESEPS